MAGGHPRSLHSISSSAVTVRIVNSPAPARGGGEAGPQGKSPGLRTLRKPLRPRGRRAPAPRPSRLAAASAAVQRCQKVSSLRGSPSQPGPDGADALDVRPHRGVREGQEGRALRVAETQEAPRQRREVGLPRRCLRQRRDRPKGLLQGEGQQRPGEEELPPPRPGPSAGGEGPVLRPGPPGRASREAPPGSPRSARPPRRAPRPFPPCRRPLSLRFPHCTAGWRRCKWAPSQNFYKKFFKKRGNRKVLGYIYHREAFASPKRGLF